MYPVLVVVFQIATYLLNSCFGSFGLSPHYFSLLFFHPFSLLIWNTLQVYAEYVESVHASFSNEVNMGNEKHQQKISLFISFSIVTEENG